MTDQTLGYPSNSDEPDYPYMVTTSKTTTQIPGKIDPPLHKLCVNPPINTPTWGGKREGAGRPVIHTDPEIRERTKKFRATDQEWAEFLDRLPNDSREAFQMLIKVVV